MSVRFAPAPSGPLAPSGLGTEYLGPQNTCPRGHFIDGINKVLLFCLGNWARSCRRARQCGEQEEDMWAGYQGVLSLIAGRPCMRFPL